MYFLLPGKVMSPFTYLILSQLLYPAQLSLLQSDFVFPVYTLLAPFRAFTTVIILHFSAYSLMNALFSCTVNIVRTETIVSAALKPVRGM